MTPSPIEESKPRSFLRRRIGPGVWLLAGGIAGGTALSLLGRVTWWLELASHFRLQLFYGSVLALLLFLLTRRFRGALFGLALCAVNGGLLAPLYFGGPGTELAAVDRPTLRLLVANVHTSNREHGRLLELVRAEDPDLVLLQETDSLWLASLEALTKDYPHKVTRAQADNFGIALFSKRPLEEGALRYIGPAGLVSVVARVQHGGAPLHILLTHLLPPVSRRNARLRDEHARAVAEAAAKLGPRTILTGDFNMTPWSPVFTDMLAWSGMRDSARGFGVQTTWPMTLPVPFRIPIDHCLHTGDLQIVNRRAGAHIGSDHLPLVIDVR